MDKAANEIRLREWASIVQAANNSGMQKKDWCSQNNISLRQFYYWQKKVREYMLLSGSSAACLSAGAHQALPAEHDQNESRAIFYELPDQELSDLQNSQNTTAVSFFPELMLQFGKYQIMVGTGAKAVTLSTVLDVIGHV